MAHFTVRNGPFHRAKRSVSQRDSAHFAKGSLLAVESCVPQTPRGAAAGVMRSMRGGGKKRHDGRFFFVLSMGCK